MMLYLRILFSYLFIIYRLYCVRIVDFCLLWNVTLSVTSSIWIANVCPNGLCYGVDVVDCCCCCALWCVDYFVNANEIVFDCESSGDYGRVCDCYACVNENASENVNVNAFDDVAHDHYCVVYY